ncbi:MAG TPA: glucosylglycerol-phosphate synthase, partial [Sphingobacteriaceae bacterium]|nr:glucosylglycerol-phosphate synthase [Sphingobacteriaceae bacterium]
MLLLATDLDGTFLAGKSVYKQQLYRLMREREDVALVFVTGRGLETVIPLLNDPILPNPHYIICDVGATIVNGLTLEPIQPLQSSIEEKWPGHLEIYNKLKNVKGLQWQEVPQMRRCSFYFDTDTDLEQVNYISKSLDCDVLMSAEKYIDILPPGVNKGSSLMQLIKLLQISHQDILVAGDTLNDLSLYNTGYKGVVVGSAEKKLIEATKDMSQVYHA